MSKNHLQRVDYVTSIDSEEKKEKRKIEKEELNLIYDVIYNNRKKGFNEILNILNKQLQKEYNIKDISNIIKKLKVYNADKAFEILNIIKLGLSIDKNDINDINKYSLSVMITERKKEKKEQMVIAKKNSEYVAPFSKTLDQKLEEVYKDLEVILETKRKPEELFEDGKIVFKSFDDKIKNVINDVDLDKYLDYIEIVRGDNSFTKKELLELQEVVNYFLNNLKNSLNYLSGLSVVRDEDEIRNFKITTEEALKPMFVSSIDNLYRWKINTIKKKIEIYENYNELINRVINFDDIGNIKQINSKYKYILKKHEGYLLDDYNKIIDMSETYKTLMNVKTMTDETRQKVSEKLIKRFIK